jgi:hypothetical protein
MKYVVAVFAVLVMVEMASGATKPRIEKILLPDTLKGKYNTVVSIDTMKITHHMLDTTVEVSADTAILKCKNVMVVAEPKEPKKEEPKAEPKKEEPKKAPPAPVKK